MDANKNVVPLPLARIAPMGPDREKMLWNRTSKMNEDEGDEKAADLVLFCRRSNELKEKYYCR